MNNLLGRLVYNIVFRNKVGFVITKPEVEVDGESKRKIMFFITGLCCGGAERMLEKLVINLRSYNSSYDLVVCSIVSGGEIEKSLTEKGVRVVSLGCSKPKHIFKAVWKLRQLLKREKVDVLHCFLVHANVIGRLACLGLPTRNISSNRVKTTKNDLLNHIDVITQGW